MSIIYYKNSIKKDTNVFGWNIYAGKGQSCDTIWYPSVKTANEVIKKLGKIPSGYDSGLCDKCACNNIETGLSDFLCREYKKEIVRNITGEKE